MSVHTAEGHLQGGRDALRLALGGKAAHGDQGEDFVPDPNQLQIARKHFEASASLFKAERRATDEARARIELAEVYLKMPRNEDNCAAAETSCRAALDVLDVAEDPATSLKAYAVLVEVMALPISYAQEGFEKERRMTRTLGILRAAEHLAAEQDDPLLRARVEEYLSRVHGERFRGDRDANLLEAIRAGRRALPAFRAALLASPRSYPSLQAHLGNCYMKLDGPRMRWLEEGLAAYKAGLAAVDVRQAPRLHRVLAGNVAMAEALIAQGDASLPEKEMMGRFVARLQSALDGGDMKGAHAAAWDTMRWAWSLGQAPNVWVAEAHKILGNLMLHGGEATKASGHFYSAAALLAAMVEPGDRRNAALLEGARHLLGKAMLQSGQADRTSELVRQADGAFAAARGCCARGSNLLAGNPKAACDEFDQALTLLPYDPLALFYRGVAYLSLSDPEAARRDFDGALNLQPKNVAALVNRAAIKSQLGDAEGALADYAAVLDINPQNRAALYNRSVMRAAAGDYEAAVSDLDRLIAAHPDMTAACALRAECLQPLGRNRTA